LPAVVVELRVLPPVPEAIGRAARPARTPGQTS